MKKFWPKFGIGLLLVVGLVILILTNSGILSFQKSYVSRMSGELPPRQPVVAFENVNLVPMVSEQVIPEQTVIVRNGTVETIGDHDTVSIPDDALVIDASGQYLMPGLVDMHVHIQYENDLLLLVANGVTSVRNMWGNTGKSLWLGLPDQLQLRQQIQAGTLLGPTIYTTGPVMEGKPAFHPLAEVYASPESAAQSVAWQKEQGYDFVKVYDHLSPETYQSILDTAGENGLPVVGHTPLAIGLDGVLGSGQETIEHLTGYIDPDAAEFLIPEDEVEHYAKTTREAGVWNCVTLSVYPKTKVTNTEFERLQNQVGLRYVSPGSRMIMPLLYMMSSKAHTYQGEDYPQRISELNRQMVHALHEAGGGILLGTDSAQPYHIPGFSIHEELALLVDAGLSPYEALAAGTRDAAKAMGKESDFGIVEVGKRADLILLENNPLADVSNLQERSGVMLNGRWLSKEQLISMLGGLEESFRPSLVDRTWPLIIIAFAGFQIYRRMRRSSEGE
ncbi:MAG: amidohydrolase family protein [Anaerolineales bacterium]